MLAQRQCFAQLLLTLQYSHATFPGGMHPGTGVDPERCVTGLVALQLPGHAIAQTIPALLQQRYTLPLQQIVHQGQYLPSIICLHRVAESFPQLAYQQVFLDMRARLKQSITTVQQVGVVAGKAEIRQHKVGEALVAISVKQQQQQLDDIATPRLYQYLWVPVPPELFASGRGLEPV